MTFGTGCELVLPEVQDSSVNSSEIENDNM